MSNIADQNTLKYADDSTAEWSFGGISLAGWVMTGCVLLLMIATFRFNLVRLWGKDNPFTGESEWAHGLLVPLISLYYLYLHKEELVKADIKPVMLGGFGRGRLIGSGVLVALGLTAMFVVPLLVPSGAVMAALGGKMLLVLGALVLALNWGLAMLLFGLVFFAYGIYPGQNDYIKDLGMLFALFGATLALCGWEVMRIAWFPIAFLVCAIPWPGLVYSKVALPLQFLAAKVAAFLLSLTGLEAYQSGSKIHIGNATPLNVAEACAGLKSLMTFLTLGGAIAFLTQRPLWQRLIITFSAIPIAIFCNVMRVTVQGLFHYYGGAQWSENFAHQFVGIIMLVPAFLLVLLVTWILDRMFVEDDEDADVLRAASAAASVARRAGPQPATIAVTPTPAPTAPVPVRTVKANAAAAIRERAEAQVETAPPPPPPGGTVVAAPRRRASVAPVFASPTQPNGAANREQP